ncbi:MAG: methyltransferase [Cenarchaeum sp. SB0661_bin_35]|nr:methyltransferase [Cenarchaeum sp. SB0667_bin_13]MXY37371.1 methyltransferase [Cenarchaeum sp. SB0664_bin_35]MXZ92991.1 methyltransferase [Cenarchaeum sp. SB0666_bin_15]MYC79674.1 methyltransferase [Cenarchaeum sp. SB0661_bin_35]MYD58723.1 methyltransferase [Cenarchaeum sp. SB0678_bin_8]MYI51400.1 methyltransferase [Cenarchaeum sp. SB0673_bin_9]MYJ28218.1 methyltransferase [Cenarchaeum sp. SB0672_bin_9]
MSSEYTPAEDTFLLCDYIDTISGESALEIGSGSGFVTRLLESRFDFVACTDIDHTVLRNQTHATENRICCNAADAIHYKFDVIVSNPPYLDTKTIRFLDTDGGCGGVQVPIIFLRSAVPLLHMNGHIAMVMSSLSRYDLFTQEASGMGLCSEIVMRRHLFFEDIYIVRVRHL